MQISKRNTKPQSAEKSNTASQSFLTKIQYRNMRDLVIGFKLVVCDGSGGFLLKKVGVILDIPANIILLGGDHLAGSNCAEICGLMLTQAQFQHTSPKLRFAPSNMMSSIQSCCFEYDGMLILKPEMLYLFDIKFAADVMYETLENTIPNYTKLRTFISELCGSLQHDKSSSMLGGSEPAYQKCYNPYRFKCQGSLDFYI